MTTNLPATNMVAIADKRYLHKYYLAAKGAQWEVVIDCKLLSGISQWTTVNVDTKDGQPLGRPRTYQADIWANRFADRPFAEGVAETEWDWFYRLATAGNLLGGSKDKVRELYQRYLERRRFCSSYDAMVRIGMRQAVALDCPQKPPAARTKAANPMAELKALFGE